MSTILPWFYGQFSKSCWLSSSGTCFITLSLLLIPLADLEAHIVLFLLNIVTLSNSWNANVFYIYKT